MKQNKRKTNNLKVSYGGIAKPLGENYFLMHGATHEQGGIGIGKDLEVENGEIVKVNPKSVKVLSNAPIMNGISPAQFALDAPGLGILKERFNTGFKYQEAYKDKHKLNDDGTKKRCGGKKKKLIGGDEKEFKLGEAMSEFYTPQEETFYEKTLPPVPYEPRQESYTYKTAPFTILQHKEYRGVPQGFVDITEDIKSGESYLYSYPFKAVYKDPTNNKYYADKYPAPGTVDLSAFTKYDLDQFRKLLPKRDYIGGDKRDVGIKIINKLPGLKDTILSLSDQYGISPDVFAQRLTYEGWLQQIASDYNRSSVAEQKTFPWQDYMNMEVSGYGQLGLDTFGDHLKAGDLNLRRDFEYRDTYQTNEDNTGNRYNSGNFDNAYDALEAKAAMLEYFTKIAKKRNIPEEDLNAYVNAMYNMGEYNDSLKNSAYIKERYSFKPYFKLGGEMKKKNDKRGISSTGERKKALLGTQQYKYNTNFMPTTFVGKTAGFNFNPSLTTPQFGVTKQTPSYITGELKTPWGTKNIVTGQTTYGLAGIDGKGSLINPQTPTKGIDSTEFGKVGLFDANPNLAGDIIQGSANIIGNLVTGLVNRSMLKDLKYKPMPTLLQSTKLNTDFNITPQVREIKNTLNKYRQLIDKNTVSSQTAIARNRHAYVDALENLLGVNAQKENIVGQLINQDRLNQQGVANQNITNYNEWLAGKYDFENAVREQQSENTVSAIQNSAQSLGDFITNQAQWRKDMMNIAALSAAYPNVTPERLMASGIPYPLYMKQKALKGKRRR